MGQAMTNPRRWLWLLAVPWTVVLSSGYQETTELRYKNNPIVALTTPNDIWDRDALLDFADALNAAHERRVSEANPCLGLTIKECHSLIDDEWWLNRNKGKKRFKIRGSQIRWDK